MTHAPGEVLQARYEIKRLLGQGAMGRVYAARDRRFSDRRVAIKQLMAQPQDPSWSVQRRLFEREGRVLADLRHPGLVPISDRFEDAAALPRSWISSKGAPWSILQQSGRARNRCAPGPSSCVMCWTISTLRSPAIVWRDLKPENILVDDAGRLQAIDFGLARIMPPAGASGSSTTTAGLSLGTPGYAPFEQYTGQADARSDVYALGATLYRILTGQVPLPAPDRYSGEELPPPRQLSATIEPDLERLVLSMLAMEPERRPTLAAIRQALSPTDSPLPAARGAARWAGAGVAVVLILLLPLMLPGPLYHASFKPPGRTRRTLAHPAGWAIAGGQGRRPAHGVGWQCGAASPDAIRQAGSQPGAFSRRARGGDRQPGRPHDAVGCGFFASPPATAGRHRSPVRRVYRQRRTGGWNEGRSGAKDPGLVRACRVPLQAGGWHPDPGPGRRARRARRSGVAKWGDVAVATERRSVAARIGSRPGLRPGVES